MDDGEGNLIPSIEYPEGFPQFTDVYHAEPTDVTIIAYKKLRGWHGEEKSFKFELIDDETGKVIGIATNNNGTIQFPSIKYTEAGTYYYTILESTPSGKRMGN